MTDYNDGNWHRWAGDGMPPGVHKLSRVETVHVISGHTVSGNLGGVALSAPWEKVCAFRVTKAHKGPREYWLVRDTQSLGNEYRVVSECPRLSAWAEVIHVREVIE